MDALVLSGVALAVLGQILGSTSLLLMKRASVVEASLPFYRRRTFHVGFAIFFFNTVVLDAVVYALTPLTIVAPITALGIVFVNIGVACGWLVEREVFGLYGVVANGLIVVGLVTASACGPHSNTTPTLEEMYSLARAPAFLSYAVPGLAIALSCCLALCLRLLPPRTHFKAISCALAAAIFGSLSVLCFKGVATVVRLSLEGHNQLRELGTWLLLLGAAVCAPANVTLMNLSFESSEATYAMPLYQALLIIATIVSGGLFYDEFGRWAADAQAAGEPGWIYGFVAGVATLMSGIVLVAAQPSLSTLSGRRSKEGGPPPSALL